MINEFSYIEVPDRYFKIKRAYHKFGAIVMYDGMSHRTRVSVGGKHTCVHLSVYDDDNSPNLDGLGYNEDCIMGVPMDKHGGTVVMLKSSLKFLTYLFPNIQSIMFKDASSIPFQHNNSISLADLYIAKHRKTWYQMYFSATPENKERYEEQLRSVNNEMDKPKSLTFNKFYDRYIKLFEKKILIRNIESILEPIYNDSESVRDFIQMTSISHKDCRIFDKWLSYYMNDIGCNISNTYFIIDRKTIDEWDDDIDIMETDQLF